MACPRRAGAVGPARARARADTHGMAGPRRLARPARVRSASRARACAGSAGSEMRQDHEAMIRATAARIAADHHRMHRIYAEATLRGSPIAAPPTVDLLVDRATSRVRAELAHL